MNFDRYKTEYRALSDMEKSELSDVKYHASVLARCIVDSNNNSGSRELSIALTKLDECVMWATKGITG